MVIVKNIDQKLIQVKYRYLRRANFLAEKKEMQERILREQQTLDRLRREVEKEQEDVEKLEHASINRLFSSLGGKSELRLEKEKAEAFRSALDYKLKQNDIEFLEYQENLLTQELKNYENLDSEYQGLLEIKRKSLDSEVLNEIRAMEETKKQWQRQEIEILEAIESGKKLRSSFTFILDNLSDLVEDTTDAKRLWYPVISQDQIEDVMDEIAKLNTLWKNFEKELQDTEIPLPDNFDQDFLVKVSDYFYEMDDKHKDTKKINTSFEHLNATYSSVREILCSLEKKVKEVTYCIRDLDLEIREKIEIS